MEVLLINEQLFKENSPIKDDTIITKFKPHINIAQKTYIQRILGEPLTDELKYQIKAASQKDATGDEITPANQALILILAPALSFYALYEGLPFHWASIVNKGITISESENSKSLDINDVAQLRRWLKDDAEEFGRNLIDYLCRCRDRYPLWKPDKGCGCGFDSSEGSAQSPFDSGIFIPKRR